VERLVLAIVVVSLGAACGRGREGREVTVPSPPRGGAELVVVDAGEPAPVHEDTPEPARTLRVCDVAHGRVLTCGAWAEGPAIVEVDDGVFRGCEARDGRVVSCGPPGEGIVPVFDGAMFRACRLLHGRIASCFGPFDGRAVLGD
jgi:hypothetical protein